MQGRNFFLLGLCCSIGTSLWIPPSMELQNNPRNFQRTKAAQNSLSRLHGSIFSFYSSEPKGTQAAPTMCKYKGYSTREVSGIQRCSFLLCGSEKAGDKYREKTKILGLPPWGQKQSDVNSSNFSTNFTQLDFALHTAPGEKWLWQNPSCRYIPVSAQMTDRQLEPGEL